MKPKSLYLEFAFAMVGCAHGPSNWANYVVLSAKCGMTISDAEKLAGGHLNDRGGRTAYGTHNIRRGLSAVWFDFKDGKLVSVQPSWTVALALDEVGPRRELCPSTALRPYGGLE